MIAWKLTLGLAASVALIVGGVALTPSGSVARSTANATQRPFEPCSTGPQGGGFRVRANGIACLQVRRLLPQMYSGATLVERRERERVYRTRKGWTCLVQGGPRRLGFTLNLCTKGTKTILFRFA